jgi:cysteine desulfurase / selenocysteine lyase
MTAPCKERFERATQVVYLDTSAEGLPVPQCEEAFRDYFRAKSRGTPGRREFHAVEAETIELAAELLGTAPANVALLSSATEALNVLAMSIDWKPRDRVIVSDLEFPTNVLPWLRLKQMGVEVVVVKSDRGLLRWEQFAELISPRTRLVSLSLVSYKTGAYLPFVSKLSAEARRVGAILSIDATQALGRCPLSLEGVDYLLSSSFKWLLGPHGLGIVYVSPEFRKKLNPASIGWYSVKNVFSEDRFENYELKAGAGCLSPGMPNFPSIYGLRQSLRFLLQVGVANIHQELKPLVEQLRQGITGLGLDALTPPEPEYASGIVSFAHPKPESVGSALEEKGIIVWAGDGRVRASVHLYNDASDIQKFLQVLKTEVAKRDLTYA